MTSGVNEILWHFVGHFHISDEIARARDLYDQSASRTNIGAWSAQQGHEFHALPGLEDLSSNGLQDSYRADAVGTNGAAASHLHSPVYHSIHIDAADATLQSHAAPALLSLPAIPATGTWMHIPGSVTHPGKVPDDPTHVVHEGRAPSPPTYTYGDDGHDKFIRIEQSNTLVDDDQVLTHANIGASDLHGIDASETLRGLIETANEQVPDALRMADHGPVAIVEFIEARDTARASATDDAGHGIVAPGRYVN